ncbi:adult-specific cuticular protein ACP-22-like [Musca vetustissima]|uniref:adult-specific cuticular protein ACP-22-like n=1 Tax=Musca vetustissima TaxID=27455 RepID=UPI002AB79A2E|nr:adult-specific cuticular protein ACP-22-like [Musca vetustissima]
MAGPLPYKHQNGGHGSEHNGEATSYAIVTKHDDKSEEKGHSYHAENHYGSNDHDGYGDEHIDYHSHPKYEFAYGVEDTKTGDIKEQWESRDGYNVKGSYSLKESDGTTRIVNYTSDKKKGFEATVHKLGEANGDHKDAEYHDYHGY